MSLDMTLLLSGASFIGGLMRLFSQEVVSVGILFCCLLVMVGANVLSHCGSDLNRAVVYKKLHIESCDPPLPPHRRKVGK